MWIFVPLFDEAHNPKVVRSNLTPATNFFCSFNYLEATAPVASYTFSVQSVQLGTLKPVPICSATCARHDVVSDPKINLLWWESLERVYEREKVVWRLFVGNQPSQEQNKLYAQFRTMLLKGSSLKASA